MPRAVTRRQLTSLLGRWRDLLARLPRRRDPLRFALLVHAGDPFGGQLEKAREALRIHGVPHRAAGLVLVPAVAKLAVRGERLDVVERVLVGLAIVDPLRQLARPFRRAR